MPNRPAEIMHSVLDWLDNRTGYRAFLETALYRTIPGGPKWRYVWGTTLLFGVFVQFVTGFFLWMSYSPGAQTAWESTYYIQHEIAGGWLLRGMHHYCAQVMVVLLAIHLLQVIVSGAYQAPREVNFWLGLALMMLILGSAFTGYLLPWDQRGFMATTVASSIAGSTPVFGSYVQQLLLGGSALGNHTLTRFFSLHAGLLPLLLIVVIGLHIVVGRRHGLHAPDAQPGKDAPYFPDQFFRDALACLGVMFVTLVLSTLNGFGPHGGAHLGPPADLSAPFDSARPEWYFLFLFQFLHFFSGGTEVIGSQIVPGMVLGTVALMPFIAKWKFGHRFNVTFVGAVLVAIIGLMSLALFNDYATSPSINKHYDKAVAFQAAVRDTTHRAERAAELAKIHGIGPEGASQLVRRDAKIQGGALFAKHCATCHSYAGHDGTGRALKSAPVAADLAKFGSREWMLGMLTEPASDKYFGLTKNGKFGGKEVADRFTEGSMATWVKENVTSGKLTKDEVGALVEYLVSLSGELHGEPPANPELAAKGKTLFGEGTDAAPDSCFGCHAIKGDDPYFKDLGEAGDTGPELTGYASTKWLKEFILAPGHKRFYGEDNAMAPFAGKLTDRELDMLVTWMLGRWERQGDGP
jgi:ubiquinol-cytochrome c reductase cytochrome b subunit